jgi:putative spermidine/putrescine transport system permease protein
VSASSRTLGRPHGLPRVARTWLLLSPALLVIVVLFLGGLSFGVAESLGYLPLIGKYSLSLDAYATMLNDPAFTSSLLLSLWIAFASTAISATLAIAAALFLRQTTVGRRVGTYVFQLNLSIPHIVGAVAMLVLLAQSGLVSRVTHVVGLTAESSSFPQLVNDRLAVGIITEYVWKEVPFIGVVVLAALAAGVSEYEDLARTLGAGRWSRLRWIVLPFIMPGVLSTSIIVFAFSFGSYEVPYLLGQPYPAALPVQAYLAYTNVDLNSRAEAQAINVVIALIVTVLILAYMWISNRYVRAQQ